MTAHRFQGHHSLEQAEGYLLLVTSVAAKLGLRRSLRRSLALKALRLARDASVEPEFAWRRRLLMGQSLRILRKYAAAAKLLWQAARDQPQRPEIWVALAWCLRRCERLEQATTAISRGLSFTSESGELHFNMACYLALLGQPEEAIMELVWALEREPKLRCRIETEGDFDSIRYAPAFQAISQI